MTPFRLTPPLLRNAYASGIQSGNVVLYTIMFDADANVKLNPVIDFEQTDLDDKYEHIVWLLC